MPFSFILSRTKFGRDVYATGGNLQAAKLSGINVNRTRWFAYFLVQIVAIAAGIILSSQVRAGNHSYAQDWGLDIISSVIIGGTSFAVYFSLRNCAVKSASTCLSCSSVSGFKSPVVRMVSITPAAVTFSSR